MPRPASAVLTAATLTLLAACSTSGAGGATADSMPDAQAAAPGGVTTVLTLATDRVGPGDSIPLALHVVNGTPDPLVLEFTSTQRYNLWIAPSTGDPIWTWAADKLFAQMMGQETIAPGDTIEFRDTIPAPAEPGEYRVIGSIATTSRDLGDTVAVTVGP
jgi:hypothetical protein